MSAKRFLSTVPRIFVLIAALTLYTASACAAVQVGAYYYPWYGTFSGGHSWTQTLRENLVLQLATAPWLLRQPEQFQQSNHGPIESHRGNRHQSFWATSWWGPTPSAGGLYVTQLRPAFRTATGGRRWRCYPV